MKITYFFEYEIDKKKQLVEKGEIDLDDKEWSVINTACKCRGLAVREVVEQYIKELTDIRIEELILKYWPEKNK